MNSKMLEMVNFTKGSGIRERAREKELGYNSGLMALNTRANGSKVKPTVAGE
jgi:hypothetical protein